VIRRVAQFQARVDTGAFPELFKQAAAFTGRE
jgi:hypothetical protein